MDVSQLVTRDDLQHFMIAVLQEIRNLFGHKSAIEEKQWLKSREVRKLLNVSPGKLQTMRKSGILPFTRIGGAIYYAKEDIQRMFEQNKNHGR